MFYVFLFLQIIALFTRVYRDNAFEMIDEMHTSVGVLFFDPKTFIDDKKHFVQEKFLHRKKRGG